jgi:hypothetical protein
MLLEGNRDGRDCGEGWNEREVRESVLIEAFVSSSSGWLGFCEVVG